MQKDKSFLHAIKKSKSIANDLIEATLFQRATGYSHKEEKIFCSEGQIVTHETTKHYPPDPTSMIFWLKNREPDRWKDKQKGEDDKKITIDDVSVKSDSDLKETLKLLIAESD
jgi:hypothetical protein